MMTNTVKKVLPHLLVIVGFMIASLAYFYPVLQGKAIFQSDIAQYIGMANEQNEFRETHHEEPYWTDAAFGGMPTYQLGANYPHNYVKELDRSLRFLPRPADYLFLYFIGMYILFLSLKIDYKLAFIGALAFGFSTYLIIILGVGHNSKAHAIAYMPTVLAGIILCFRKKYLLGGLLLAIGMALEISANHFQMTYYLLLLVIVLGIVYFIDFFKKKKLTQFFIAIGVMVIAVVLSVGTNATNIMATQEYADFSTRGQQEISINPDGSEKEASSSGLDYEYITEYSYGIGETFNLFIPRLMGGGSAETFDETSATYDYLMKMDVPHQQVMYFLQTQVRSYWGDQPIVAAPAYIGAVLIFLFVLSLFLVHGRLKTALVAGTILALLLSWGDNFSALTQFFINNVPLYNKFRAITSIQVIVELCIPILAILGLSKLFSKQVDEQEKWKALKWASLITGGLAVLFLVGKSVFFDFTTRYDQAYVKQLGAGFVDALQEDRMEMFTNDTLRSLIFVLLAAGIIYLFLKKKMTSTLALLSIGLVIVIDLVSVNQRYVNKEDFVSERQMRQPFQPNKADQEILKDKGHYRVLDLSANPLNSARASYFHNSLGGYHAAKPKRIQQLFDFHIQKGNQEVFNMLNIKYFIKSNQNEYLSQKNPNANGNAWFINDITWVENQTEAILALDSIDTKQTVLVEEAYRDKIPDLPSGVIPSARIDLIAYQPNQLTYRYENPKESLAVFSEVYYPSGWVARVDGQEIPHFRANYLLRAAVLPAGLHELTFSFEPQVVQTGSMISLISFIVLLVLLIGAIIYSLKKEKTD